MLTYIHFVRSYRAASSSYFFVKIVKIKDLQFFMYLVAFPLLIVVDVEEWHPADPAAEVLYDGIFVQSALFVETAGEIDAPRAKTVQCRLVGHDEFVRADVIPRPREKFGLAYAL